MPQTSDARRARWPGHDSQAIEYLTRQGYKQTPTWGWKKPSPSHVITSKERDALIYLIEEWDWAGVE